MSLLVKGRSADSVANQSMQFWGICCENGKRYRQTVGQRFRITMAVLDPKSSSKNGEKTVSLFVIRSGVEYLLCVLKHGEIYQVNLNLIFDEGEDVLFYINGSGKVYLSGYQLTDSKKDVLNDENGYLCPLAETSQEYKPESKGKVSKIPQNAASQSVTLKSKKKAVVDKNDLVVSDKRKKADRNRYSNEDTSKNAVLDDDDDDDDPEDGDYVGDEESDDDDSDESDDSEDDDGDEEEEDAENEEEIILYSKESQRKRKLTNMSQSQKRSRYDSFTSTSSAPEKSENVICLDNGSDDSSDYEAMNSSIGNTPMPKKQTSIERKKSKKKKKLSEISNLSVKSVKSPKLPVAESTPNRTENAVKKLEGGVEIQDVIIGRGPEAKVGKMVHVFYVGRFQNKQIFDSRVPGKKPFSFKLGAHQVIKGWDVGIQGMKVGGKRKLKIPPNMGYGSSAIEGIPPNSTLYFVVELQAVS